MVTSIQNSRLNSRRRTMCLTASCSTRVHYQFNSWPYDLPWMHPFWERQRQQRFEFPNYYYPRLPEKPVWDFAPFANGICPLTDPFGDPLALNIDKTGHFIKMINAPFNQYFEQGLLLVFLKSPVRIVSTCIASGFSPVCSMHPVCFSRIYGSCSFHGKSSKFKSMIPCQHVGQAQKKSS